MSEKEALARNLQKLQILLIDIEANAVRAWGDGSLSNKAWPTDLARRVVAAVSEARQRYVGKVYKTRTNKVIKINQMFHANNGLLLVGCDGDIYEISGRRAWPPDELGEFTIISEVEE